MLIETVMVGTLETNCYILSAVDSGRAVVIDPGAEGERIAKALNKLNIKLETIILTHGHPDHIMGVKQLKEITRSRVLMHREDLDLIRDKRLALMIGADEAGFEPNGFVEDGQKIEPAGIPLTIIHTPGHSKGSVCIYYKDTLFSGDLLFCQGVGRVDLPGGSQSQIVESLRRITRLPLQTKVYPGHGPSTTVEAELRGNLYLKSMLI